MVTRARFGHKNQYVWRERGVPVAAAQLFPIIGHERDYQFGLANNRSGSQSKLHISTVNMCVLLPSIFPLSHGIVISGERLCNYLDFPTPS